MNKAASSELVYKILLCDDDESYRRSTLRMLNLFSLSSEHAYFKTFEAANAEEAFRIIDGNEIDCVLLDYLMPGRSGISVLEEILKTYPSMCVIMVTGAGSEPLAVETMKAGAMDYLVKDGITIERLEKAIVGAITRVRMMKRIEEQNEALMHAERQRVMLQSLATACHHIAQPVTVLRTYIVMLKRQENSPEAQRMLTEAFKAIETLVDVLWKLKHVSEYRTEKYIERDPGYDDAIHNEILSLPGSPAPERRLYHENNDS